MQSRDLIIAPRYNTYYGVDFLNAKYVNMKQIDSLNIQNYIENIFGPHVIEYLANLLVNNQCSS